jgi:hypothetical protein
MTYANFLTKNGQVSAARHATSRLDRRSATAEVLAHLDLELTHRFASSATGPPGTPKALWNPNLCRFHQPRRPVLLRLGEQIYRRGSPASSSTSTCAVLSIGSVAASLLGPDPATGSGLSRHAGYTDEQTVPSIQVKSNPLRVHDRI